MREVPLRYIAGSSGNEYDLKSLDGIRTKEANYHTWAWEPDTTSLQYGVRLSAFKKSAAQYNSKLLFNQSYDKNKILIEELHDDFELDVRNKTLGKIIWGDYYIDCYIISSSTAPGQDNLWVENDISIWCPKPFWIKEQTKSFYAKHINGGSNFLDYKFDFDYDYSIFGGGHSFWDTESLLSSEFKMIIYGGAIDPELTINGYPYKVNDTLGDGEYITIDSRNHTVIKTIITGEEINAFNARAKDYSVFNRIPGGLLDIRWSGTFGFDITLYHERSEPEWKG